MIDLQLNFYPPEGEATVVVVSFDDVPRYGAKVHFVDSEGGHILKGRVREVLYTDIDGETNIVVGINQE